MYLFLFIGDFRMPVITRFKIKYIEPTDNYNLFVIFENGIIKIYSIKDKISNPIFSPLKDLNLFKKVKVDTGGYGISWNDDIDLSEYELWKNGKEISSIQKLCEKALVA